MLMKARMLCFLLASAMTPAMAAQPDFSALIGKAERQTEQVHAEVMKAGTGGDSVALYNNNWFYLRHKKRIALAQADVRLRKNQLFRSQ